MKLFILFFVIWLLGVSGDILTKMAAAENGAKMYILTGCAGLLWAVSAFGWTQVYKMKSIVEVMSMYSPIQLMLLACVGIFWFKEPLNLKVAICLGLTFIIVWLMSSN